MKKSAIIIAAILIWAFAGTQAVAQKSYYTEVIDSIDLGDYEGVLSQVIDRETKNKLTQQLTIYKDGRPATTTFSKTLAFFDFHSGDTKAKPLYHEDINKDGIDEIIIRAHSSGDTCCNMVSIHALKPDKIADITRFDMKEDSIFYIKDIDNDSIPELFFRDAQFAGWHAPIEKSPMPLLIWKWDDGQYRLANFEFSDYLLAKISDKEIKKLPEMVDKRVKEYDAKNEYKKYPPAELWGLMLDYIYAGKESMANSVFEKNWPSEIPGKKQFYDEFQKKLKESLYWKGLQSSKF
jgi:hypothetical protein